MLNDQARQKDKYCVIPVNELAKVLTLLETERRRVATGGGEKGNLKGMRSFTFAR